MKRCPTPRFLAVIAAALCLSLFAVSGFAQFQTGNIYGKVQAKDGVGGALRDRRGRRSIRRSAPDRGPETCCGDLFRRARERQAHAMNAASPKAPAEAPRVDPLLDEELNRLPEKYRRPLVLCYLEGKTQAEAARLLGWTKGTVAGRLARARALLGPRLARRGLALAAVLGALEGSQGAAAPRSWRPMAHHIDGVAKVTPSGIFPMRRAFAPV